MAAADRCCCCCCAGGGHAEKPRSLCTAVELSQRSSTAVAAAGLQSEGIGALLLAGRALTTPGLGPPCRGWLHGLKGLRRAGFGVVAGDACERHVQVVNTWLLGVAADHQQIKPWTQQLARLLVGHEQDDGSFKNVWHNANLCCNLQCLLTAHACL